MWPKYRNFDEFERDEIRPGMRAGWSLENINDPSASEMTGEMDFDEDPFERALLEHDAEEDEDDDSEDAE
jgi:hypothetical protein